MFEFLKPNRELNVFQKFAHETNGVYIPPKYDECAKTEVQYGVSKIIFDYFTNYSTVGGNNYEKTYSRVICSYKAKDDFRFEIYDNGVIRSIEKFFGSQDIEIGRPDFDKKYVIKSNSPLKLKSFLQNENIRRGIQSLKEVNVMVSDSKGIWGEKLAAGTFELSYFTGREIKDTEELMTLLHLFREMIDQMNALKLTERQHVV